MKKIFITLFCLSVVVAVKAQNTQTPPPPAPAVAHPAPPAPPPADPRQGKFKFDEEVHNFGSVPEGPKAECDFEFKNIGKEPIVIKEAHGSCGCTVPTWPKDPILPKHKATIHVTYNTQGRIGPINKDVIITSNAQQNPMKLHITGTVTPKGAAPAPGK